MSRRVVGTEDRLRDDVIRTRVIVRRVAICVDAVNLRCDDDPWNGAACDEVAEDAIVISATDDRPEDRAVADEIFVALQHDVSVDDAVAESARLPSKVTSPVMVTPRTVLSFPRNVRSPSITASAGESP